MILVDMSQIMMASIMMQMHISKKSEPDEEMVRHMILNSLRMYRTRFLSEFGEMVLCYDSRHYWRRDYFPEYKHSRRKSRGTDDKNWDIIFYFFFNFIQTRKYFIPIFRIFFSTFSATVFIFWKVITPPVMS